MRALVFAALMGISAASSAFEIVIITKVPEPQPQGYCWENRGGDQGCKFD